MRDQAGIASTAVVLAFACMSSTAHPGNSATGAMPLSRTSASPVARATVDVS